MIDDSAVAVAWVFIIVQVAALAVFVPIAICATSGSSDLLVTIGLAFEIAGVLGLLGRVVLGLNPMVTHRSTPDRMTWYGIWASVLLLPTGFLLQFISVVWV